MKIKNFVYPLLFAAGIAAGIYKGGFTGGFVAGACAMLFIFVTLGKHLARKATERMDAAIKVKREFYDGMKE